MYYNGSYRPWKIKDMYVYYARLATANTREEDGDVTEGEAAASGGCLLRLLLLLSERLLRVDFLEPFERAYNCTKK